MHTGDTNEALAIQVQQGSIPALEALWNQVKRLAGVIARRYLSWCREAFESAASYDDLEQELFLAVWEAAKAYDPEKGYAFTSYLKRPVQTHCMALLGRRTSRTDALARSVSLDIEIPGGDGLTLQDALPDEAAGMDIERVEERIWTEQLRADLETALSSLPPERAELLRCRYYDGASLEQAAAALGITAQTVRVREQQAFRKLRAMKQLQRHREEIISTHGLRSSRAAYERAGASSVELTAEKLERMEWGDCDLYCEDITGNEWLN